MGFYLRKSISVGPLRFNLSKNGIGVSAGIPGFRLGKGPRGNYIHMGRGGLYYRATLAGDSSPQHTPRSFSPAPPMDPISPSNTHAPLQEIESADVTQIVDSSSRELLEEMNSKQKKKRIRPLTMLTFGVLIVIGLIGSWPSWLIGALVLIGALATYAAQTHDTLAKTVVLFYEFDQDMQRAYAELHSSAELLSRAAAAWHVAAQGAVHDRKYHAGASKLVDRKSTSVTRAPPPYVKTNIETVSIGVGRQTLHFFPERVLVYAENGVGAVSYQDLGLEVRASRFIEDGSVPSDAQVVGHTWRYVNKSGGPDRRFSNNTQLPICMYDEIAITSASGLNELVQVSKTGIASSFAAAIQKLARTMPPEGNSKPSTRWDSK